MNVDGEHAFINDYNDHDDPGAQHASETGCGLAG